jgi:hypothetical protein
MLSSFLGVLPILIPPLCALALSCDQSPIPRESFGRHETLEKILNNDIYSGIYSEIILTLV